MVAHVVILGIVGFLFYAYGIYVIERIYNALYLVYMAISGSSFYALIYGVTGIRFEGHTSVAAPGIVRGIAVGFLLFVALVFHALWIGRLVRTGAVPKPFHAVSGLGGRLLGPAQDRVDADLIMLSL